MAIERLTSADRVAFHAHLRRTAPLDDADLAAIDADVRVRRLPARAMFLACGEQAVDCGAVLAGVVREYFPLEDGREVTRGFAEARYQRFRALYAALEPAISLRHVALYVGITPEHLSRLRRRLEVTRRRGQEDRSEQDTADQHEIGHDETSAVTMQPARGSSH